MGKHLRELGISLFTTVFAIGLCMPVSAFAETGSPESVSIDGGSSQLNTTVSVGQEITPATECTAVIKYYEYPTFDDPSHVPDEGGRLYLGKRVLTGLKEGQVLNAWDYVEDIPGFFFFDGWPFSLTVSTNPDENVFELFYGRRWDNSCTVNYYLMTGADLTATNWKDALAPEDVSFTKLGFQTIENLPAGMLIDGSQYETPLDDTYTVGTFPNEIRLDLNPENNVLNVLYTPNSIHLPDGVEIPDDYVIEAPDEPLNKDDLVATLPDDLPVEDFIVSGSNGSIIDIVDSTIMGGTEPVQPTPAEGNPLVQTGDEAPVIPLTIGAVSALALVFAIALLARRRTAIDG